MRRLVHAIEAHAGRTTARLVRASGRLSSAGVGRGSFTAKRLGPSRGSRRLADPRIEAVAGVEASVVLNDCQLRLVEMADVVLGWIFRAPPVEGRPHAMLQSNRVAT